MRKGEKIREGIVNALKKANRPMSSKEIEDLTGYTHSQVSRAILSDEMSLFRVRINNLYHYSTEEPIEETARVKLRHELLKLFYTITEVRINENSMA